MRRLLLSALLIFLAACATPPAPTLPPAALPITDTPVPAFTVQAESTLTADAPASTLTEAPRPEPARMLIVSFDGLRPELITAAPMPNFIALMQAGAYTLNAQTIYPSVTLPSHASMLTGLCPADHGVDWNDYEPERGYAQGDSIFAAAHDLGMKTAMIVGKRKLSQITRPENLTVYEYVSDRDTEVAAQGAPLLAQGFDLAFVHFPTIDTMGHVHGWMSDEQVSVARRADEALGMLLAALDEAGLRDSTLIILSADHGGHDTSHGSHRAEDMTIPWVMAGPGVIPQELFNPILTTDTAATAAWALKLPYGGKAVGQPVLEAFGLPAEPRTTERCP